MSSNYLMSSNKLRVPEDKWIKMGRVVGRMFLPLQDFKSFFDRALALDPDGHMTAT